MAERSDLSDLPRGLRLPIIQAPMAGGPSTVALAAAVSHAGGLGFLAAGMITPERLAADIAELRAALGEVPFGVNVFCPSPAPADPRAVAAYAEWLAPTAKECGVELGEPRFHRDHYDEKIALLAAAPPPVVSFVFGCPARDIATLQAAGAQVWVTVTQVDEAQEAAAAGADALVVQGREAGGHRGGFVDDDREPVPLLPLLEAVRAALPSQTLIAAGGLMTASQVAEVLGAGAAAAQLGTALLLADESGIGAAHAGAVRSEALTVITRAFSGRRARGVRNAWTEREAGRAPSAYPEVLELTAPLRAEARGRGDADGFNLWAGEGHALATGGPAAEIVSRLAGGR